MVRSGVPSYAEAHNVGVLRSAAGDLAEAEGLLRDAVEQRPDAPESRYSLAQVLLGQGRFAEAWPLYEARRELPRLGLPAGLPDVPEWRGDPLNGRRLLVFGEQGFGDQIMFARFMPTSAAYVCAPSLWRLFPNAIPGATNVRLPQVDCWALVGSLPLLLGLEDIPPPPRILVETGYGGGVGVMTRSNPHQANDANRRLTEAEAARLLTLGRDLSPEATGARNFLETAKIIADLDVVITVDTAMAHLAASMGKETRVLIPSVATYWPWRQSAEWYPSARLYPRGETWDEALDQIAVSLRR